MSACMSGTRGSGVLSSTGDVLVRGVGGVCDMCMCLARGGVGGVDERIGFGLYQSSGDRGSVGHVSVFWLRWCGWCRWRVGRGLGQFGENWIHSIPSIGLGRQTTTLTQNKQRSSTTLIFNQNRQRKNTHHHYALFTNQNHTQHTYSTAPI